MNFFLYLKRLKSHRLVIKKANLKNYMKQRISFVLRTSPHPVSQRIPMVILCFILRIGTVDEDSRNLVKTALRTMSTVQNVPPPKLHKVSR